MISRVPKKDSGQIIILASGSLDYQPFPIKTVQRLFRIRLKTDHSEGNLNFLTIIGGPYFYFRISSIIFPEWMLPKCNCLSCKRNVYSGKRQSMEILYQTEKRLSLNQSSPRTYEFSRRKLKIMSIEFLTCSHFEIFSFDVLSLSSFRAKQSQSDVG